MKLKTKRLIGIGIVASAVGTVIATAIIKGSDYVFELVKSLSVGTWHLLTSTLSVPIWLVLAAAAWIVYSVYLMLQGILLRALEPQPHTHYFRDQFWGLTWIWTYSGRTIDPPWCYCPSCETQLVCVITVPPFYDTSIEPTIVISCERCRRTLYEGEGDQHRVQGQIERRIRTGEWKQVVERHLKERNLN